MGDKGSASVAENMRSSLHPQCQFREQDPEEQRCVDGSRPHSALRSPTSSSSYQHKTASLVASRMGFFPPHPQLPHGYQQQHPGYSSSTTSSSGRLVALQQLHVAATTTNTSSSPSSVLPTKGTISQPQSPWSGFMISCRPHHPYHPRYSALMMSDGNFSNGHLPAESSHTTYIHQNSHSNSSSVAGSEEDSMDKSEEGEEEEDDEVKINTEKIKGETQQPQPAPQEKKRNPYSIEELLKKPDTRKRSPPPTPATLSLQTMLLQPPCGLLVDKPCTCLVSTAHDLSEASSPSTSTSPITISPPENLHKPTATCNT
ncbi:hypothetical protein C0J52_15771 [Blattella germanica]|nr:hypothetical protein C0J52_15771 [Blattella germanica]